MSIGFMLLQDLNINSNINYSKTGIPAEKYAPNILMKVQKNQILLKFTLNKIYISV